MSDDLTWAEAQAQLEAAMRENELRVELVYVLPEGTRRPSTKDMTLQWAYTVYARDVSRLRGTYHRGIAFCPSYRVRETSEVLDAVWNEVRTGKRAPDYTEDIPAPTATDVLTCLLTESSAVDHANFESWAADYGYDPDSRRAEAIYKACLGTGTALRACIGDSAFQRMRELAGQQ